MATVLAGLAVVFFLFQIVAGFWGSDRGQAGLAVAAVVLAALIAVEWLAFGRRPVAALQALGLGRPGGSALMLAIAVSAGMLAVLPVYAAFHGRALHPIAGWPWLLPGLLAQAGLAEEALFRGYLFRHMREGRGFWRAALLACIPFATVHLLLFATLPWPVALAAIALAVVMSFPLAHLFEIGGNSVWPPAVLHAVVQGAIKLVEIGGDSLLPLIWIGASAVIPYAVFLVRRDPRIGPKSPKRFSGKSDAETRT